MCRLELKLFPRNAKIHIRYVFLRYSQTDCDNQELPLNRWGEFIGNQQLDNKWLKVGGESKRQRRSSIRQRGSDEAHEVK
jgi:hypothetical protein